MLRRAGLADVADAAQRELDQQVERPDLVRFSQRHGVTIDELISRMGGSP